MVPSRTLACLLALTPALAAAAQCDMVIKEDFRLGDRPSGNRGRIRTAQIHDGLGDYWTQVPGDASVRWISGEPPSFQFAASSVDPLEWPEDPAFPEYNGTAFGEDHGVSLLPLATPAVRFVASLDAVPIYGLHDGILFGLTATAALADNFASGGELWVRYAGTGEWELHTRTQGLLASGVASTGSVLTGFTPLQIEYTPGTRQVRLAINHEVVADLTLDFDPAPSHVGFECDAPFTNWQVVNNLVVRRGALSLLDSQPSDVSAPAGGSFTLTASTAVSDRRVLWLLGGLPLEDGPQAIGNVSGSSTLSLTVTSTCTACANPLTVQWSDQTAFEGVTAATLTGADIKVEGYLNASGVLVAREIHLNGSSDHDAYDKPPTSAVGLAKGWGKYRNRR